SETSRLQQQVEQLEGDRAQALQNAAAQREEGEKQLQLELAQLQQQIDQLGREREDALQQGAALRDQVQKLEQSNASTAAELNALRQANQELSERLESSERERGHVARAHDEMAGSRAQAEEQLRAEMAGLLRER